MIRLLFVFLFMGLSLQAQSQVKWLRFDQLDSAMTVAPKPVFLDFYTAWCSYCKKMDQEVFTDGAVAAELNTAFYAVRFDAETDAEISFDGLRWQKGANQPAHSLAQLFSPKGSAFAPPLLIILDDDCEMKERINAYQSRKKLLKMLRKYSGS